MHWWMEGSTRCWKRFLARLTLKSCAWVARLEHGCCARGRTEEMQMNLFEKTFSTQKLVRNVFSERKDHLVCEKKVEFPPSGRNFQSKAPLQVSTTALLCFPFLINCVCLLLLLNYRPRQQAERQKTGRVDWSNVKAARRHMVTLRTGEDGDKAGPEMNNLSKILFWFVAFHGSSLSFHSPLLIHHLISYIAVLMVICCRPTSRPAHCFRRY